jgi:histidyl-tRNA synthetase
VWNESDRHSSNVIADDLRARGIAADVAPSAVKIGKQIRYADRLGIPYVWFPAQVEQDSQGDPQAGDEVKNIVTGEQERADSTSWEPDIVYAQQSINLKA